MINSKDVESGYSALHRAAFFGHIQTLVFLIKQGDERILFAILFLFLLTQLLFVFLHYYENEYYKLFLANI